MISVFSWVVELSMTHTWAARAEPMMSWVPFAGFAHMTTQRCHRTTVYPLLLVVICGNGMFAVLLDNVGHMGLSENGVYSQ